VQVKQELVQEEELKDLQVESVQVGRFWVDFKHVPYGQYYMKQIEKVNFSGLSDAERLVAIKIMCPMVSLQIYINRANQVYVGLNSEWYHVGHIAMVRARLQNFFSRLAPYWSLYFANYLEPWNPRFEGKRGSRND